MKDWIVAGVDLAVKRPSAYAIAKTSKTGYQCLKLGKINNSNLAKNISMANLIVVDAPLHPPYKGFRSLERKAQKYYGAKLLPGGMAGVRELSRVGYSLFVLMVEASRVVVETHPGSMRKTLGLAESTFDRDIVDAVIALSTGLCLLEGNAFIIEDTDGVMVLTGEECRSKILKIIKECLLLL
ncbi:MAG: hypothetical protein F7C33_00680 [Desulfurococcales archaeon]|nr:hypothetical protein [Desulfurococcales archaeon]